MAAQLVGTWRTDCELVGSDSQQATLVFTATGLEETKQDRAGLGCTPPEQEGFRRYSYTVGPAVGSPAGAYALDLVYEESTQTPLTTSMASRYNQAAHCGFTTWQAGQPKSVLGRLCGSARVPNVGDGYFQIIWVDGDVLQVGQPTAQDDCRSQTQRCSRLSPYPYTRQ